MLRLTLFKSGSLFLALFLLKAVSSAPLLHAAVTITPEGTRTLGTSNTLYYSIDNSGNTAAVDTLDGYTKISSTENTSYITIKAASDKAWTASGSNSRAVALYAKASGSSDFVAIPLNTTGISTNSDSTVIYFTDDGTTISLQFSLYTMCNRKGASLSPACNGVTNFQIPGASSQTTFLIKVIFGVVNQGSGEVPTASTSDRDESSEITIGTHISTPTMGACPTAKTAYLPGDGQIQFNGDVFRGSSPAGVPITEVVALFRDSAPPAYIVPNGFDVAARVGLTQKKITIGGFTNTTNGADHVYQMLTGVRDASGAMSSLGCLETGIQTSEIQGFLRESNCFIATATFQNSRAWPVMVLRAFREQVLRKSAWGREIINIYEKLSPPAADWLIAHPWARPLTIALLVPFIAIAWIWTTMGGIAALFFLGSIYIAWKSKRNPGVLPSLLFVLQFAGSSTDVRSAEVQPYIDGIKTEMKQEGLSTEPPKGSYTETLKKQLPPSLDDKAYRGTGSYIKALQEDDPSLRGKNQESKERSYSEMQKARLGPGSKVSPIDNVLRGKSELEPKRETRGNSSIGFRFAATADRQITLESSPRTYDEVYGDDWIPELNLHVERKLFNQPYVGSLGLEFGLGFSYAEGEGKFAYSLGGFGQETDVKFKFMTIPVSLGGRYTLTLTKYIQLYARLGGALILYYETRTDGKSNNRGYSRGILGGGGLGIPLDFLTPKASWELYSDYNIKQYYLTLDYQRLGTVGGDVDFTVASYCIGFNYEF